MALTRTLLTFFVCMIVPAIFALSETQVGQRLAKNSQCGVNMQANKASVECEVLIIGSGFAGAYAAYKLSPQYTNRLCLVERLERDGGRILDVSEKEGGPVFGAGALRVMDTHPEMIKLAHELGIELQDAEFDVDYYRVRGKYFFIDSKRNQSQATKICREVFPAFDCKEDISRGKQTNDLMYETLFNLSSASNFKEIVAAHPDIMTLAKSYFGDEGFTYLRETATFQSDFTALSVPYLLSYLANENFKVKKYPLGGMSQFVTRMIAAASLNGMRIYRNQPVVEISSLLNGELQVVTKSFKITAKTVLCSIPPLALAQVTGDVAEEVKSAAEFSVIAPVRVATVATWWNDRWWENSKYNHQNLSRIVSHGNCFNMMEIPTFPYGRDQNVTRAVYDDGSCVDTWQTLILDPARIDTLIDILVESLQSFFDDVRVPRPRLAKGLVHENAWHVQKSGSAFSNKEVFQWSLHPVRLVNFALIGEAYTLNRWCDAARLSVNAALERLFGHVFLTNETGFGIA